MCLMETLSEDAIADTRAVRWRVTGYSETTADRRGKQCQGSYWVSTSQSGGQSRV